VDCGLCHAGQRYKDTPTTCVACHRIDDAHQGQRGTDCESCHTTAEWKEQKFDHFRKTGFALTAGHSGLACVACHAGNDFRKAEGKACVDCHRSDDTHQGRNGVECKTCHTTKSWKDGKFDHSKETKFALKGAHAELGCVACHKGAAKTEKLETTCVSCHRGNDPHQESLGADCGTCHGEKTWQADVRFDHDLTDFPLAGLHATTSCDSCHVDKKFAGTGSACIDCHRPDDVHKGNLGDKCADCHTPNDWRIWTFDHNAQTDFRLDGAHSDLRCVACHVRPPGEGRGMARDCGSCHRRDDRHNGQFGADCARCHNTRTFSGARRSKQ
ncbi:MAG: cytochrome C, partial [Gammaproteobacteria bacterium]|nr:cytochrome C [Gammaproteobacteria bacterium]